MSSWLLVWRDNPGDCRVAGRCCRFVGPEVVIGDFVRRMSGGGRTSVVDVACR